MISFPPCKINLGLQIVRKRSDGFHDLISCFYPVPLRDMLEIIPAQELSFTSSGLFIPGSREDNLCLRAYLLLKEAFDLPPVSIYLHKIVPMGAGLGGGSSDAAWTLRILNTIFDLQLTTKRLADYASQLGSDCAFFIHDQAMMGSGRGEVLAPVNVNLRKKYIVVVKPDVHISTAEAYAAVQPHPPERDLHEVLSHQPVDRWKDLVINDFEASVFRKFPVVAQIKHSLYAHGALYASMSGSGSAVFGIFTDPVELKDKFPGVYYWSGML